VGDILSRFFSSHSRIWPRWTYKLKDPKNLAEVNFLLSAPFLSIVFHFVRFLSEGIKIYIFCMTLSVILFCFTFYSSRFAKLKHTVARETLILRVYLRPCHVPVLVRQLHWPRIDLKDIILSTLTELSPSNSVHSIQTAHLTEFLHIAILLLQRSSPF
jgi:hypothetical protein